MLGMKYRKRILFLIVIIQFIVFILFTGVTVSAAGLSKSDDYDDICYLSVENGNTVEECNNSVSYLDIIKVFCNINTENQVKIGILVRGEIKNADNIHYIVWYNNSVSKYMMSYSNGINYGWAKNMGDNGTNPEIMDPVVTNHSITVTYDLLKSDFPHEMVEGEAYELNDTSLWIDRVPNQRTKINPKPINGTQFVDSSDNQSNGSNNDAEDTPGFTYLIVFLGLIILCVIRKH